MKREKEEAARIICNSRENFFWNGYLNFWKLFKSVIEKVHLSHLAGDKGVGTRPVTGPEHAGMRLGRQRATPATQQQRQRRTSVSRLQMARHFVHPWIICGAMPNANTSAASLPIYACVQPALRTRILRLYALASQKQLAHIDAPQPRLPTCFSRGRYHLKSKQEDLQLSLLKSSIDLIVDFQSSIEYLSFYLFLHLSILIEGTDPFELMVSSYWFDLIHVSNVSNYRIFMIVYVHNKTGELIIQTNWETNVLKWISSIYRFGREESNFVNTNREVNRN